MGHPFCLSRGSLELLAVGGFGSVFAEVVAVEEGLGDAGAFCSEG